MSKVAVGFLIAVIVAGNIVTITLLISGRDSGSGSGVASFDNTDAAIAPLLEAINALRNDVDRLSVERARPSTPSTVSVAPVTGEEASAAPAAAVDGALAARFDEVVERLQDLEKMLVAMKDVNDELAVAKLREKRQEQFRAEDGFTVADELLAQKQFAVGANGILTFLEAHPEHPDARDLMRKAREAFLQAGYGEKALWLQGEIMKKYPDHRGSDLYSLAMLEKRLRKLDDALRHINESMELATTDQDQMNRMFYRAYLIHQRDGDDAGLEAYREVQRLAGAAGIEKPANVAGKRADEIETRLAAR